MDAAKKKAGDSNVDSALNFDDLRKLAKTRLPKLAFDVIDGGVDDARCLQRHGDAFQRCALAPRYLNVVSAP
jgi:L-lactate dehydrogenase (cytochrome)/(S)-mandelate dehydrogenase